MRIDLLGRSKHLEHDLVTIRSQLRQRRDKETKIVPQFFFNIDKSFFDESTNYKM